MWIIGRCIGQCSKSKKCCALFLAGYISVGKTYILQSSILKEVMQTFFKNKKH